MIADDTLISTIGVIATAAIGGFVSIVLAIVSRRTNVTEAKVDAIHAQVTEATNGHVVTTLDPGVSTPIAPVPPQPGTTPPAATGTAPPPSPIRPV